jgi:hypothetical protein
MLLRFKNISKDFMDREKSGKMILWMHSIRQRIEGSHCKYFEWFEPRICERGGKLVYEMRFRIKTMEEELRKQTKKEKRSNVLLFVSWELSVAFLFDFMFSF